RRSAGEAGTRGKAGWGTRGGERLEPEARPANQGGRREGGQKLPHIPVGERRGKSPVAPAEKVESVKEYDPQDRDALHAVEPIEAGDHAQRFGLASLGFHRPRLYRLPGAIEKGGRRTASAREDGTIPG